MGNNEHKLTAADFSTAAKRENIARKHRIIRSLQRSWGSGYAEGDVDEIIRKWEHVDISDVDTLLGTGTGALRESELLTSLKVDGQDYAANSDGDSNKRWYLVRAWAEAEEDDSSATLYQRWVLAWYGTSLNYQDARIRSSQMESAGNGDIYETVRYWPRIVKTVAPQCQDSIDQNVTGTAGGDGQTIVSPGTAHISSYTEIEYDEDTGTSTVVQTLRSPKRTYTNETAYSGGVKVDWTAIGTKEERYSVTWPRVNSAQADTAFSSYGSITQTIDPTGSNELSLFSIQRNHNADGLDTVEITWRDPNSRWSASGDPWDDDDVTYTVYELEKQADPDAVDGYRWRFWKKEIYEIWDADPDTVAAAIDAEDHGAISESTMKRLGNGHYWGRRVKYAADPLAAWAYTELEYPQGT